MRVKMLHSPYGGLHLQQVGRIVLFVLYQLLAGVRDDLVLPVFVDLRQNRA